MKKFFFSLGFVLVGGAMWWALANTARFSVKKWDAKFESVLRHGLTEIGVKNSDVLSSVNEVKHDARGQYVERHLSLSMMDRQERNKLIEQFEKAGADVHEEVDGSEVRLIVNRGARTYQQIHFVPAPKSTKTR